MRMSWITRRGARTDAGAPPRVSIREHGRGGLAAGAPPGPS